MTKQKIRRLFLESDILDESDLHRAQRTLSHILDDKGIDYPRDVFDEIIDYAWHEPEKVWEAISLAEEIYGDTSLVPLTGFGSYTGSPVLMDAMMQKAIEEGTEGKRVYFLRPFSDIEWQQIDVELLHKAFKRNELYTTEYNENTHEYEFVRTDINAIE